MSVDSSEQAVNIMNEKERAIAGGATSNSNRHDYDVEEVHVDEEYIVLDLRNYFSCVRPPRFCKSVYERFEHPIDCMLFSKCSLISLHAFMLSIMIIQASRFYCRI